MIALLLALKIIVTVILLVGVVTVLVVIGGSRRTYTPGEQAERGRWAG